MLATVFASTRESSSNQSADVLVGKNLKRFRFVVSQVESARRQFWRRRRLSFFTLILLLQLCRRRSRQRLPIVVEQRRRLRRRLRLRGGCAAAARWLRGGCIMSVMSATRRVGVCASARAARVTTRPANATSATYIMNGCAIAATDWPTIIMPRRVGLSSIAGSAATTRIALPSKLIAAMLRH